jgi:hypothetical protein
MRQLPTGFMLSTIVAAALVGVTPARATHFAADTVETPSGQVRNTPRIVLDPVTLEPHVLYSFAGGLRHAWCSAGAWSYEPVTVEAVVGTADWAIGPAGRLAAVYSHSSGDVVCARRDGGVWIEEPIPGVSGPVSQPSLAVDAATDEPCLAYSVPEPPSSRILRYARKQGFVWVSADADTVETGALLPSLALDAAGNPFIAYARSSVFGDYVVHAVASRVGSAEFVRDSVDTGSVSLFVSAAVHAASGEPRIAYFSNDSNYTVFLMYASRAGSGNWATARVDSEFSYGPLGVCLALDAAGNPAIAYTKLDNFLAPPRAAGARAWPRQPLDGITSGRVVVAERLGGAGVGPFSLDDVNYYDTVAGPRALVRRPGGLAEICFRSPNFSSVDLYGVLLARPGGDPTSVESESPAALRIGRPRPNPREGDAVLSLPFTLADRDRVTLALYDLQGRRVASRGAREFPPGANAATWDVGALAPGIYWLRLTSVSGLDAAVRWVVVR